MSQIKPSLAVIALTLGLALSGCGDKNPQAVFNPDSGSHPGNWTASHNTSAKADIESCVECHGEDFGGGISKVACTQCHLGSSEAIHPLQWGQYAYARHKGFINASKSAADPSGTASCANAACHGTSLTGASGPNCATTCHLGGATAKHPTDWTQPSSHGNYVIVTNGTGKCMNATCHGTDLKGVFLSGPSCTACHLGGTTAVHPTTTNWRVDHAGYTLPGQTVSQTRARCDIAACHGNDRQAGGMIKTDKSAAACQTCHIGELF